MKDSKSVLLLLALIVFFAYVLRHFLGKISSFFFVPIDRLLFISHSISPVIMWMLFGLLVGLIYGSFIAIKKFKLDFKLLIYPIVISLIVMSLILLVSFFINDGKVTPIPKKLETKNNTDIKPKSVNSKNYARFNDVLNKGIVAAENEEYKKAEKYFELATELENGNPKLDSLAKIYSRIANDKCRLFKRDAKLKYIPNYYYKYAALLTGNPTPEVCK